MNDTTPKQAGLTVEQTQVVCRRLAAINYQLEAILTNGGQSPVGSQGIPDNPTDERIILQAIWEETQYYLPRSTSWRPRVSSSGDSTMCTPAPFRRIPCACRRPPS